MIAAGAREIVCEFRGVEAGWFAFVLDVAENGEQTLLAVNHVLGSAETARSEHCRFDAHSRCPGINDVLHVSEFSGGYGAGRKHARGADANGVDELLDVQSQNAANGERRGKGC